MAEHNAHDRDTVDILGVAVDRVDMSRATARIAEMIDVYEAAVAAGEETPPVAHVVTANSEIVMMARGNPEFAAILSAASLVVPDGIGVVWASRVFGNPLSQRVAGIDLMEEVLAVCAERGWRPFFLGAAPGVAEEALATLQRRYPALRTAGTFHGYFDETETQSVLARIRASGADLLLVAMGAPRQEYWIGAYRRDLGVPVAVGVGGSLDVWGGRAERAPLWMREVGLEWAYRLLRQPRRALRMLALPRFAVSVLRARWRV